VTRLRQWLQRLILSLLGRFWSPAKTGTSVQRVLIFEMTRLGDVVSATCLIDPLKRAYPQASLSFIADASYAPLFEGDARLNFIGLPGSGLGFLKAAWGLRKQMHGSDLALFSASPSARNSILCWLSKPGLACGYLFPQAGGLGYDEAQVLDYRSGAERRKDRSGPEDHLVRRAGRLLDLAGLPAENLSPRLFSELQRKERFALLHAGANWAWRRWPFEKFQRLAEALRGRGWQLRLIAPEEKLDLKELKELCAEASLFVGNDSGPMHLAASLGTRCIGLFGPNLESRSGPWPAEKHKTLHEEVPCRPCAQTVCVQPGDWCMDKLSLERVLEAV
jgi:ADP-heptose:LPS heptosyltransferase